MIIYKSTNLVNNKVYIGQTVRTLEERRKEHERHSDIIFDKAIQKHGKHNFEWKIIDTADNIKELNKKEIYWIKFFNSLTPNGYNQCYGGDNTFGYTHKKESKIKMSKTKSKMYTGKNNPFYGKKHTYESRMKMSKSRKGRVITKEWAKKIAASNSIKVINLDTMEIFNSIKSAAEKYNLKATHISRVCKHKRKRTGGFRWIYYHEYMAIPCQGSDARCNDYPRTEYTQGEIPCVEVPANH